MRKPKQSGTTRVTVVVTNDIKEALRVQAAKEGRSLSGLVNVALSEYIKKNAGR